jgi:hypothetical protein
MIVLLGELAAMDLPVRGLRDGFAAFCVAGTACCAAITLRRCLERRPAWGSDAIVAALVAGLLVSRGAAGRIPLPELLLAGYCAGALLFDVGATWRRTRFAGARAMDGHPGKVSYKVR